MASVGSFALLCVFVVSAFGIVAAMISGRAGRFERVAERAIYNCLALYAIVIVSLLYLLSTAEFRFAYVAGHTNRDLSFAYKMTALWAGQEGSLVFWGFVLSAYSAAIIAKNRKRFSELVPHMSVVFLATIFFFSLLSIFVSNPFNELVEVHADGRLAPFIPADGQGLNPLLQHWAMVIHPPLLYLGYVGCIVPFAFAMAALVTRRLSNDWLKATRRWTLIAWLFLGAGILLGAKWAYVELGWGGYWGWDPVENASLMPWLTMTAFLHSASIQERKGMLKVWNVSLVALSFLLSIFGTFITRSGIVSSVHAFSKSSIGTYFTVFMLVVGALTVYFILRRLPDLKSETSLDSLISRESAFLFNNVVLLGACVAILWGTMYPFVSEEFWGQKITVGPPFFNRIMVPVGLLLLFLTGIGPLVAWGRTSLGSIRRNLLAPAVAGLIAAAALYALGYRHAYALLDLGLCAFVLTGIILEFYRGARARQKNTAEGFFTALYAMTMTNKRRHGGYLVHLSVVLLFVGFAGAAFNSETKATLREGDQAQFKGYTIRCKKIEISETPNYLYEKASVQVLRDGRDLGMLYPEGRVYKAGEQTTTEVAIRSNPLRDLYLVFAGMTDDRRAVLQIFINPLVHWIWVGSIVMLLGTLIAVLPDRLGGEKGKGERDKDRRRWVISVAERDEEKREKGRVD
ncbi:MAG: heme lyase CcmF/NrfE family subunit [Acidobacteriota bacterium]